MDIVLLLKSIAGLVAILGILLLLYFYVWKSNKETKKKPVTKTTRVEVKHDFASLLKIIKDKKSTAKDLGEALDLLIKYHGVIPKKLGLRVHPDFEIYSEILLRLCRHKNANKDIVVKFDRELEKLNPEYKREINDSLTKGLNSRGI
ncbi:hypothetical protein [Sulfurimonas sp.]